MLRGTLSAYTAMQAQVRNQEVIANNLSNVATSAYRKDVTTIRSLYDAPLLRFEPYLQKAIGYYTLGAWPGEVKTIHRMGPLEVTNNPLDIALPEKAWLEVETSNGPRYTRRGDLEIGPDGYLTVGGFRVMGDSGPISVGQGKSLGIDKEGQVLSDGEVLASLRIVTFQDENLLRKEGDSLYSAGPGAAASAVESKNIVAGALEKSSVDPVKEMVDLIASYRTYEAAQKALQAEDEALGQAVNKVGQLV